MLEIAAVRGFEVRRNTAYLPQVSGLHVGIISHFEQPELACCMGDVEMIEIKTPVLQGKLTPVDLIFPQMLLTFHGNGHGVFTVFPDQNTGHRGGLNSGGDVDIQGTDLIRCQGAEGVLVDELLAVEKNTHIVLLVCVLVAWT